MASATTTNKFATMLHKRTNRFTLILVYALLEWTLIILLLLNSLFSYLIIKFSNYFGLKKPCILCSRLDHIFEHRKSKSSYKDLLCDVHCNEIAQLGYCSNHRKLAESKDMCYECSSDDSREVSRKFAYFPWMKQIGCQVDDRDGETCQVGDVECSCCGVELDRKVLSPCFVIKPSWKDLEFSKEENLIKGKEEEEGDEIPRVDRSGYGRLELVSDGSFDDQERKIDREMVSDAGDVREECEEENCSVCGFDSRHLFCGQHEKLDVFGEKEEVEDVKEDDVDVCKDVVVGSGDGDGKSAEIMQHHMEFLVDRADYRLIPVELIDAAMAENESRFRCKEENEDFIMEFDLHDDAEVEASEEKDCSGDEKAGESSVQESEEEQDVAEAEAMDFGDYESSVLQIGEDRDSTEEHIEQVASAQVTEIHVCVGDDAQATETTANVGDDAQARETPANVGGDAQVTGIEYQEIEADVEIEAREIDADVHLGTEEVSEMRSDEDDAEISIGTEIPEHEHIDEIQDHEVPPQSCLLEEPSTSSTGLQIDDNEGSEKVEDEIMEFMTVSVDKGEQQQGSKLSLGSNANEIEDEKAPDTPSSVSSLDHFHKKLLLLERRDSGTEESLDGSAISDIDCGDGLLTVEKLTSVLKAERKALNSLYTELEEERSAAAVAASQTMAMINRLQEEKAAMQMEALQYQRMMEEQAEYDQEALQLLNELMVKREKEKQELEKELEVYRKKVQEYEAKEKLMMSISKDKSTRSRTSSISCSNAEDSDGLSVDLDHEMKEDNAFNRIQENGNHNTPVDAVLYLDESLADFEEERLSILEQLKGLEEKLLMLSDEEDFEDVKHIKHCHEANGNGYDEHCDFNGNENGHFNGMNGKHQDRRNVTTKPKRLLPLFDATETENGEANGNDHGCESVSPFKSLELGEQNNKLAVVEEVDHVYERLQALEADREFLKHCIGSLRKGDKGLHLLQEILQHLRDLRNVELRSRNVVDGTL